MSWCRITSLSVRNRFASAPIAPYPLLEFQDLGELFYETAAVAVQGFRLHHRPDQGRDLGGEIQPSVGKTRTAAAALSRVRAAIG